jgi:hypothetical protein
MTDNTDLIARLERVRTPTPGGVLAYVNPDLLVEAAAALERLEAWKAEAIAVLCAWEEVWEAAGRPGRLGSSKARAVRDWIEARDAACGHLPNHLIAKALDWCARNYRQLPFDGWTPDDIAALRAASFEVTE